MMERWNQNIYEAFSPWPRIPFTLGLLNVIIEECFGS